MKKTYFVILVLAVTTNALIAGGPWPQKKGMGYFKLSEWWTVFDQHYTDNGQIDPNVTTGIFNTFLYAEYGVSSRFTTVVNLPLLSRNYMNNLRSFTTNEILVQGEALNSIGDIDLGIKYGLSQPGAKIPVAASITFGLPTGNSSGGTQNNLQTGDGEFNQLLQLDAGTGFKIAKNVPAYASVYTGFNNRTNNFSDEVRYGAELGVGLLNSKLWINTKLNVVESLKNGATAETTTSTSLFANNSEFTSIALEANLYVSKKVGFSASIAGAVRGEIIAAAPSYSVGVFLDLSK